MSTRLYSHQLSWVINLAVAHESMRVIERGHSTSTAIGPAYLRIDWR
jgi:hypothetical protein